MFKANALDKAAVVSNVVYDEGWGESSEAVSCERSATSPLCNNVKLTRMPYYHAILTAPLLNQGAGHLSRQDHRGQL